MAKDCFVIEGGHALSGTIVPAGNKNEALPCVAASLLTDEEVVLTNLPDIGDVRTAQSIMNELGASVARPDEHTLALRADRVTRTRLTDEHSRRIRGSITFAGPLLARCGEVMMARPGGDRIGRRRIDTHIQALQAMGAKVEIGERYIMKAPHGLRGADILLDEASVTATENAVMGASLADGCTVIRNAASEPHVQGLCRMLVNMGATISGIGTNRLEIEGVESLHGVTHRIGPDYIEVGSFIGIAAATNSKIRIRGVTPDDLRMILLAYGKLGLDYDLEEEDGEAELLVPDGQRLEVVYDVHGAIPKIDDAPWPGFPADMTSVITVVATQASGTVLIHEKMFESRMFFIDRLIAMGARVVLCDPHRVVVVGPSPLTGARLTSPDIRAGVALVIAALAAEGQSVIQNIEQVDRGYERFDERLRDLGAKIERV